MKKYIVLLGLLVLAVSKTSAIEYIAGKKVLNSATVNYSLSGITIQVHKVKDPVSGRITTIATDLSGNIIDETPYGQKEKALYQAKYGKLEPALYELLQTTAPNELLDVIFWLTAPDVYDLNLRRQGITKIERKSLLQEVSRRHFANAQPVIQALQSLGYRGSSAPLTPAVSAKLLPDAIHKIAPRPEVVRIYRDYPKHHERDYGTTTERATFVWKRGIAGDGVTVGIHEAGGVSNVNPYLHNTSHPVVYWKPGSPNISAHTTGVAGIIASTHDIYRGTAYGVDTILSANIPSYSDPFATFDSAALWIEMESEIINMSWGGNETENLNINDRWVDHLVKTYGVTIVKSAGNSNTYISSPGKAFNCITVGGINDRNNGNWSDDVMYPSSNWKNPASSHNDREKPEVVALAQNVRGMTTANPWVGDIGSGTSYAAPAVTGLAVLLLGRNNNLSGRPEAIKALIMASAFHNIEPPEIPDLDDGTDDKDGVGCIVVSIADSAAANDWFHWQALAPDSFKQDDYIELTGVIPAVAGDTWRVVICWDATAAGPPDCDTDTLNADLDLEVYDPYGSLVDFSTSFDNSYETVQFRASSTGGYSIRINSARFDEGTNTNLGVAWAKKMKTDACAEAELVQDNTTINRTTHVGSMFWDRYTPLRNSSGRELLYKLYAAVPSVLFAKLTNITLPLDIFFLNSCSNTSLRVWGDSTLSYNIQNPDTYYIAVDGNAGTVDSFTLEVLLKPMVDIASIEVDTDADSTIYARYKEYTFTAKATSPFGGWTIDTLFLQIEHNGSRQFECYFAWGVPGDKVTVTQGSDLVIDQDHCTYTTTSTSPVDTLIVNFKFWFDWDFPDAEDLEVNAKAVDTRGNSTGWVEKINNINFETRVDADSFEVTPDSCAPGDAVQFSGTIVYQGSSVSPPDSEVVQTNIIYRSNPIRALPSTTDLSYDTTAPTSPHIYVYHPQIILNHCSDTFDLTNRSFPLVVYPEGGGGVWVVSSLWDSSVAADTMPGTFRYALRLANSTKGPDVIKFEVSGTIYSVSTGDSAYYLYDSETTIDGTDAPGGPHSVVFDGIGPWGLVATQTAHHTTIRGLTITDFAAGFSASSSNNFIDNNYLGAGPGGKGKGNSWGITISGTGKNNSIVNNVISSNADGGITISTDSNTVYANKIGTDAIGTQDLGNGEGVLISGDGNTVIDNLISGNSFNGVRVSAGGKGNRILNNTMGATMNKASPLPNHRGVYLYNGARENLVEGNTILYNNENAVYLDNDAKHNTIKGNVASGNGLHGFSMASNSDSNLFINNLIGTTPDGSDTIPNDDNGVYLHGRGNVVQGNVISGNGEDGILVSGTQHLIIGNLIGTDITGTIPLGNQGRGIAFAYNADSNTIGGTNYTDRNVISASQNYGVYIAGSGTHYNKVLGNYIGTDISGMRSLTKQGSFSNVQGGIGIGSYAHYNTIGDTAAGGHNVISGNQNRGVDLSSADSCEIMGNYIGLTADGYGALGNEEQGISIYHYQGAGGNLVHHNVIAGNGYSGIAVTFAPGNKIYGNYIGTNKDGDSTLPNGAPGTWSGGIILYSDKNKVGGTTPEERNVVSGNHTIGIYVSGDSSVIQGNYVGTDASGTHALGGNDRYGIYASGSYHTIGDTTAGGRNIVSGNDSVGIYVRGFRINVWGNYVGTDTSGNVALPNEIGIYVGGGAKYNKIGGTMPAARNVISANSISGIALSDTATKYNKIQGNYIGVNADGTAPHPNQWGIVFSKGAKYDTIGGTTANARNIISGNESGGIKITGSGTSHHAIIGNFIGPNKDGEIEYGKAGTGNGTGITISDSAQHNVIGGTTAAERNIISGNLADGVIISGASTDSNTVSGNYIGTDTTGQNALPNWGSGIRIEDLAQRNLIGGTAASERNILSGNSDAGVWVSGAQNNTVSQNYIGTNVNGNDAIPNEMGVALSGGAQLNTIGGATTNDRNIISGNDFCGVYISDSGTDSNTVENNFIGTDVNGTADLPNGSGVSIFYGASSNAITQNTISGNEVSGVEFLGSDTRGNEVTGNYIGTNSSGTAALGNIHGVAILYGAVSNTIGGTGAGDENIISGNDSCGVFILGAGTDSNEVIGNYIGTDGTGTAALANLFGVFITDSAEYNIIGGTSSGHRNVISGNTNHGVWLSGAHNNILSANYIGLIEPGDTPLANGDDGIFINNGAHSNIIGGATTDEKNVISGNSGNGIHISDYGTWGNRIIMNYIGPSSTGGFIGTQQHGIYLESSASSNIIGEPLYPNLIAHNLGTGVFLEDANTDNNTISGNQSYNNIGLGIDLAPVGVTENDSVGHTGPNNNLNFPVITSTVPAKADTFIVSGTAPGSSWVEIFAVSGIGVDPSDHGEASAYLGRGAADSSGYFSIPDIPVSEGDTITATATDTLGNTSEFALNFEVVPSAPVIPALIFPADDAIINDSTPTFVWRHTIGSEGYYTLQYATDSSFAKVVTQVDSLTDTTYIPESSLSDTIYYWRVSASNFYGSSGYQAHPFSFTIDAHAPDIPALLFPVDSSYVSDQTPTFTWTQVTKIYAQGRRIRFALPEMKIVKGKRKPARATGLPSPDDVAVKATPLLYVLEYALDSAFTQSLVSTDSISDTIFTVADSLLDTTYYWRVMAFDGAGNLSDFSSAWWFGVDTQPPQISNTTVWIDTSFAGPFAVYTTIDDNIAVGKAELWYKTSVDTNWAFTEMDTVKAEQYYAGISIQPDNTTIWYYVYTEDIAAPANAASDPSDAPDSSYSFLGAGVVEIPVSLPTVFALSQNIPNPFTHKTTIKYQLPKKCRVSLKVYDITGSLVAALVNCTRDPGYCTAEWNASDYPTGIYFVKFTAGDFTQTQKLILMR